MSANPLGCRMDDNIRAMLDGLEEVSASAEGVVDL
jgi:hypothetical protein